MGEDFKLERGYFEFYNRDAKKRLYLDGKRNLFNFLVIPDFFDLPKGIALNRSVCLIVVSARWMWR